MESRRVQSRLTPIDDEYETCERTTAVLRIGRGAMSPSRVTELLGVTPTSVTVSGEGGIPLGGAVRLGKSNVWVLSSEGFVASKDLRRHVDWILATVYPSKSALFSLQDMPDVTMDISCV